MQSFFTVTNKTAQAVALTDFYDSCCGSTWEHSTNWLEGDPCTWFGVVCSEDSEVVVLAMPFNNVCGTIPESLSALTTIESILLEDNYIVAVDESIWNLPNLRNITFSNNFLVSLPSSFSANLTLLDVSSNQINSSIPESIGNLTQLSILLMQNNNLTGTIPNSFGNLINLQEVKLSNNQLSGTLPPMEQLVNLTSFSVSNNQLTGSFPAGLTSATNLFTIDLSANQFTGEIPSLTNLRQLYYLELDHNNFTGALPGSFLSSYGLIAVDLSYNQLTGVIPSQIYRLPVISTVLLSHNQFVGSLSKVTSMSLSVFDASYNQLSGDLNNFFESNCILGRVDLSHNLFSGNVSNIAQFGPLYYLDLSSNQLTGTFPPISSSSIQTFIISDNLFENELSTLIDLFSVAATAAQISLDHNLLVGTVPPEITTLPNSHNSLKIVDISYNNLTGSLPNDVSLDYPINISGNNFTCPFPASWSLSTEDSLVLCSLNCCEGFSPAAPPPQDNQPPVDDGLNTDDIIYIVLGSGTFIALVIIVVVSIFIFYLKRKYSKERLFGELDESEDLLNEDNDE